MSNADMFNHGDGHDHPEAAFSEWQSHGITADSQKIRMPEGVRIEIETDGPQSARGHCDRKPTMTTPDVQYRTRHAVQVLEDEGILDHPLGRHQAGLKDMPEQPASPIREASLQAWESIKKAGHAPPSQMILRAIRACRFEFSHHEPFVAHAK